MRALILIFILCFLHLRCDLNNGSPVIYSNSFETAADTTGWRGVYTSMFINDPAPLSGRKSLRIGGGCIQPAASLDISGSALRGKYKITCWAKTGRGGGSIYLNDGNARHAESAVAPADTLWNYYQSEIPFSYSGTSALRIEIYAGGIIPANIYLDNLKILKVE